MGSLRISIEEKLGTIPYLLIHVILEWVVIILLFIDGFLAFLSNEIARVFELRIPCLLCTRLDHIVVHRDCNFYYNDSICEDHKKDISTLAYCHVHNKLSDIRSMCQGCLLSLTEKDSDRDRYKSLVGILHRDVDSSVEDERRLLLKTLKKDGMGIMPDEKIGVMRCSCCGDPDLKPKSSSKLNRSLSRSLSINAPVQSPRALWFSGRKEEGVNMDLPHIRYTELKLSDTESELHEDGNASHADNHGREYLKSSAVHLLPDTEDVSDDTASTPIYKRGNKFFGIPLSDAAPVSPRWANRSSRKLASDKLDLLVETIDENEGDGDILTRLKRQVDVERKSLMALYMELDEERSASTVAANNAMAMITRLQAEKAAVQMEALQYQRMMEEQAEYDQEALRFMTDMIFKREEDIKILVSELEMYKEKYGQIKKIGSEVCEVDVDEDYQDMNSQALSSSSEKSYSCGADQHEHECGYERSMEVGGDGDDLSLDFERDRSYLLGLLRDLENKLVTPLDEIPDSSEFFTINEGNKATLTRELSLIRERLRAIEAESGFFKHAAMTLQRGAEGTKLLTEIVQHLRKLRHNAKSSSDDIDESS